MFRSIILLYLIGLGYRGLNMPLPYWKSITSLNGNLGGPCCCGVNRELTFNNFDFESAPTAPPGGWIDYAAGQMYDGWNVTSGSISIHHPSHGNMGAGNPNGASQHMDLHGGTPGAVLYPLTGLTSGYTYTIELWYAIHIAAPSATANLKIDGGAWLNVSWTAFNPGNSLWLKASYMFIAKGNTTTLELIGSGPLPWGGMLIDDIHLYECPGDLEEPKASNIPTDIAIACIKDLPPVESIIFTDNCDPDPVMSFIEKKQGPICDQIITRTWKATDKCGNFNELIQKITIKDEEPPTFLKYPSDTTIFCPSNLDSVFSIFISRHGGANAKDNCVVDHWDSYYNHKPRSTCDTSIINFIVYDACLNSNTIPSQFIVLDTTAPVITPALNVTLDCGTYLKDSLAKWLDQHGYSTATDNCSGKLVWKNDFNGDSLASEIKVTFRVSDECGNYSETLGIFKQSSSQFIHLVNIPICHLSNSYSDTTIYSGQTCDSLVISRYYPARQDTLYIESPTCDITLSINDTFFLTNQEFCDSIIIHNRPYVKQKITLDSIYDCLITKITRDSFSFNQNPCDSIYVKISIPAKSNDTYMKKWTCDINQEGIDTIVYTNNKGCDSIVIVETVYRMNVQTIMDTSICALAKEHSDSFLLKGQFCDSLVIINFHSKKTDTIHLLRSTCDNSLSGIFIRHLMNSEGCDSIIVENIKYIPSDTIHTKVIQCDPPNVIYDTTYLKNIYGCDSIIVLFNEYIKKDTLYQKLYTCDSSLSGIFYTIFQGINCDSVVVSNILWKKSDTVKLELVTCHLQDVKTEVKYFSRVNDCDSIVLIKSSYIKPFISLLSKDISCYNYSDGHIEIDKIENLSPPFRIFLNQIEIQDLSLLQSLSKGVYSCYVIDSNNCISDSLVVTISEPDSIFVKIGYDSTRTKSHKIPVTSISNRKNLKYTWLPSTIFDCPNCDKTTANIDSSLIIQLLVEDENGCTAKDEIRIKFRETISVWAPNVFSPNGDHVNDYFFIQGDEHALVELLQIFDRWGNLVFQTKNIPTNDALKGWDGQYMGQSLNPSVFVYYAKVKLESSQVVELKGDLTIVK